MEAERACQEKDPWTEYNLAERGPGVVIRDGRELGFWGQGPKLEPTPPPPIFHSSGLGLSSIPWWNGVTSFSSYPTWVHSKDHSFLGLYSVFRQICLMSSEMFLWHSKYEGSEGEVPPLLSPGILFLRTPLSPKLNIPNLPQEVCVYSCLWHMQNVVAQCLTTCSCH